MNETDQPNPISPTASSSASNESFDETKPIDEANKQENAKTTSMIDMEYVKIGNRWVAFYKKCF